MTKLRVGVVRGGPSSEYDVSLRTGESVLRSLSTDRYVATDILLSRNGEWYINGVQTDLGNIAQHVDVIWNALHGAFGEDGKVQRLFDQFGIPYTGSDSLASAVGMHKGLAKDRFRNSDISVPEGEIVDGDEDMHDVALRLFRDTPLPVIVKPVSGGSSLATRVVTDPSELLGALTDAAQYGDVLVEELISGREATVCVIDGKVVGSHYALFPIEIVPPKEKTFFDYDAKYSGESQEICPGRFTLKLHSDLRDLAIKAHQSIGARHYSRTDFMITEKGIYALEINTLPGLTSESLVPKALAASGMSFPTFLDHVIDLSTSRR